MKVQQHCWLDGACALHTKAYSSLGLEVLSEKSYKFTGLLESILHRFWVSRKHVNSRVTIILNQRVITRLLYEEVKGSETV